MTNHNIHSPSLFPRNGLPENEKDGSPSLIRASAQNLRMSKANLLPTSDLAKRICDIFHRRHTTPWLPKEKRAFLLIRDSIVEQDLRNIERRYKTLWPPMREKNSLRHNLYTWLNNYTTEADEANMWAERNPERKKPRVIVPMPPTPSEPFIQTPEEKERTDKFMEMYRARRKASVPTLGADSVGHVNDSDSASVKPNPASFRSDFQRVKTEMKGTA